MRINPVDEQKAVSVSFSLMHRLLVLLHGLSLTNKANKADKPYLISRQLIFICRRQCIFKAGFVSRMPIIEQLMVGSLIWKGTFLLIGLWQFKCFKFLCSCKNLLALDIIRLSLKYLARQFLLLIWIWKLLGSQTSIWEETCTSQEVELEEKLGICWRILSRTEPNFSWTFI